MKVIACSGIAFSELFVSIFEQYVAWKQRRVCYTAPLCCIYLLIKKQIQL